MEIEQFKNFDLLLLGFVIAAIGILGFVVYFNNPRSITNKTFLTFALVSSVYAIFNYSSYQVESVVTSLWLIRIIIFSAVWYAFFSSSYYTFFPKTR